MCNSYWKSMEILNGKEIRSIWAKFYYKQSASLFMQCVKLSFMIEDFEKWREVMALNFLNLVLQRYWKSLENEFEKCVGTLILDTFSTQRSPIHRVQMHGAWNRATHLYPPHNNSISSSDNNNIHAAHWADHQWNAERADNPTRLGIFIPDTNTPRNDPPKKSLGPAYPHRRRVLPLLLVQIEYGLLCGLWVWCRRTSRRSCCPRMSNPLTSPWTAWLDGWRFWAMRQSNALRHLLWLDQTFLLSGGLRLLWP